MSRAASSADNSHFLLSSSCWRALHLVVLWSSIRRRRVQQLYVNYTHGSLTTWGHPVSIWIWLRDPNACLPLLGGRLIPAGRAKVQFAVASKASLRGSSISIFLPLPPSLFAQGLQHSQLYGFSCLRGHTSNPLSETVYCKCKNTLCWGFFFF